MCLNPRKILNPKRHFSQVGGHPLYLLVPCGKCAECQRKKVNEYMLRSYYEALDTFNNDGFILNDTLTYKDSELPHISDYIPHLKGTDLDCVCFCPEDFRLFFVRLRERLNAMGYERAAFRYFLASEYGSKEGCSHRPHYHVLFFVKNCTIDPIEFSMLIADCWYHGRTDGVPYKGEAYVRSKRLFSKSTNNDLVHLQNVCQYVTKYLTKDSKFDSVIRGRISSICSNSFEDKQSKEYKDYYKQLYRKLSQFHRQSKGFGLSALNSDNIDSIYERGVMQYRNSKNVVKDVPLPTYFARKLFYNFTKDFRNKPIWTLTNEGVAFKLNRLEKNIDSFALNMESWFKNLAIYCPDYNYSALVSSLLDGRSFRDYAEYILLYKGRLIPINESKDCQVHHAPCKELFSCLPYEDSCMAYLSYTDSSVHEPYITFNLYHEVITDPLPNEPKLSDEATSIPVSIYAKKRVIDQNTYIEFSGFDELFNLYCSSLISVNEGKQRAFELKQHLSDLYKGLQTPYINPFNNLAYD